MSITYTPTTWVAGTTPLSAANMNNIETGVAACVTAINAGGTNGVQKSGDTMTGDLILQTTLSGSNKTVAEFWATDGKHFILQVTTANELLLYNATDSVVCWRSLGTTAAGGGLTTFNGGVKAAGNSPAGAGNYSFIGGPMYMDSGLVTTTGGGALNVLSTTFTNGAITGISFFSGTGSGTVSHGLGGTPLFACIECSAGGSSMTDGVASYTSTQVTVTAGGALSWKGFAIR